ncbi:MAG: LysR family transcriptional regulator [Ruminococcus sp.]|nr:LysR family transcriptional regulator [Ruminococcus sp.]
MIEIYLLEQLVAFAKYGTLSKAADKLHISQPALSRSMQKLETELGVNLFVRKNKKIALNETGDLAARLAQANINQNREMVIRIRAFDKSLHSINVGSCAPFPMTQLMPILQKHFGEMTISTELIYGKQLINGLKNGIYKICILNEPSEDSEIFCQSYIDEHLYISVPENHRLAKKQSVKFNDLDGEKFLLFQHIGFWKSVCEEYMKNTDFLVQVDRDSLLELIEGTNFPAFSSDGILATEQTLSERIYIPINEANAHYTYYIACLNKDKKKFSSFFNEIHHTVINKANKL